MNIRLFDPARDMSALCALYTKCFAEPPWHEKFDIDELTAWFNELSKWPDTIFLVGTQNDRIVAGAIGFNVCRKPDVCELVADTDRNSFYIAELFVDSTYRKRGSCQRLTQHMLRLASLFGNRRASVRTHVSQPIIQHVFVTKLGFKIVARHKSGSTKRLDSFEQNDPDSRIIMTGNIRDHLAEQKQLVARGCHSGY
jgi:ribosomal protein S18 acetylase RimI-like enzyme